MQVAEHGHMDILECLHELRYAVTASETYTIGRYIHILLVELSF